MARQGGNTEHKEKLSAEFRRRLSRSAPSRPVRAVVLLETNGAPLPADRRRNRQEAVRAVRATAASAKRVLDPILIRVGGRWLTEEPDSLGSIGVEAPAAGLIELANDEHVRAILEDQRVSALPKPTR